MKVLQLHELSLAIGDRSLCDSLSITMKEGEIWAILGPNGSGKTTLLHTLAGLRNPNAGSITLTGKNVQNLPRRERAQALGILLQEQFDVFPGSVAEAVLAGRYPYKGPWEGETEEDFHMLQGMLRHVDLAGFETRELATLSGGERRRVGVATLLMQDPPVMLLDEPTNHLDPRHQLLLLRHLQTLAGNRAKTIIMVLHDYNLAARFCSHAILLHGDGKALTGTIQAVMQEEELSRLYGCRIRRVERAGQVFFFGE